MKACHLKQLHPDDVTLFLHVEQACFRLAKAAHVKLSAVEPVPKKQIRQRDGLVFGYALMPENVLQLTLRIYEGKGWWKTRVAEHNLIDTIAHEMAHLVVGNKEKAHHGPMFFRAFGRMLLLQEKIKIRFDIESSGAKLPP